MSDELLDKLGNVFVHFNIGERYQMTFARYVELYNNGNLSHFMKYWNA